MGHFPRMATNPYPPIFTNHAYDRSQNVISKCLKLFIKRLLWVEVKKKIHCLWVDHIPSMDHHHHASVSYLPYDPFIFDSQSSRNGRLNWKMISGKCLWAPPELYTSNYYAHIYHCNFYLYHFFQKVYKTGVSSGSHFLTTIINWIFLDIQFFCISL